MRASLLSVLLVEPLLVPGLHGEKDVVEGASLVREGVLNRHGHRGPRLPADDAVGLQVAQRIGERLCAHAERPLQLVEAHGPHVQLLQHEERLLAREDLGDAAHAAQAHGVVGRDRSSGNVAHNLELVDWSNAEGEAWADVFDTTVRDAVTQGRFDVAIGYQKLNDWQLAAPTNEHYLPLLVALGAVRVGDHVGVFNDYRELGSMSMTSFAFWQA